MPRPLLGNVVKRIAGDVADTMASDERLFAEATEVLLRGDKDCALSILNTLRSRHFEEFMIMEHLVKGDVTAAETASMRLAASTQLSELVRAGRKV